MQKYYNFVLTILAIFSLNLYGQLVDDISIHYSYIHITEAKFTDVNAEPRINRQYAGVDLGIGRGTLGVLYQKTTSPGDSPVGTPEEGIMITAGYDFVLSRAIRLEGYGRIGVSPDINPAQPLYATDTDVRLNLVWYNRDGVGRLGGGAFFPSTYVGVIVNRYGRIQEIAGLGTWWQGVGLYLTGFHSFNGVDDPLNTVEDADIRFANIKNSGVSFSISYDFKNLKMWVKKNEPLENGGNDLTFSAQYQFYFD